MIVRKRPLNYEESTSNTKDIVACPNEDILLVKEQRAKLDGTKYIEKHKYRFDQVYDENKDNYDIYKTSIKPLIQ